MRRLGLALVLVLLLSSIVMAKPETVDLGPYKVSFDLNTTENYSLNISKPHYSETYDGANYESHDIRIENANHHMIMMSLNKFDDKIGAISEYSKDILLSYIPKDNYQKIDTYERTIDGTKGVLASCLKGNGDIDFLALYYPDYTKENSSGSIRFVIASNYSWDEGTLNLLKTIHVELPENKARAS